MMVNIAAAATKKAVDDTLISSEINSMTGITFSFFVVLLISIVVGFWTVRSTTSSGGWKDMLNFSSVTSAAGAYSTTTAARRGTNTCTATAPLNTNHDTMTTIPFILIQEPTTMKVCKVLFSSLESYEKEMNHALKGMSTLLEQTLALEQELIHNIVPEHVKISTRVQQRITKMSECFEHNLLTMQHLLSDFPYVMSLPDTAEVGSNNNQQEQQQQQHVYPIVTTSTLFQMVDKNNGGISNNQNNHHRNRQNILTKENDDTNTTINAYNSVSQIVAHLVRDWTKLGTNLRQNLYGWCRQQLRQNVGQPHRNRKISRRVFVPGAGMGRLSYDIWKDGYTVEANELSLAMAAATYGILHQQQQRNNNKNVQAAATIHPFVLDALANEVDQERRYDSIEFPDDDIISHIRNRPDNNGNHNNSLSFTIGNFVSEYYMSQSNTFDAVVTCFFIDTATNLYDYIHIISNLLKKGGAWINVGPVQWHGNAIIRPSVSELYDLLSLGGLFDIVLWQVDTKPISYRQDDDDDGNTGSFVRSTDYPSYRPLRFVAISKS